MEVVDRSFVVVVEGFDSLATHPAGTAANTLCKCGYVESAPLQAVGKTEGITREIIANHETVIIVDHAIRVAVLIRFVDIADVASPGDDALEVRAGSGFLVALEEPVAAQRIVGIERISFLDDSHDIIPEVEILSLGVDDGVPAVGKVAR